MHLSVNVSPTAGPLMTFLIHHPPYILDWLSLQSMGNLSNLPPNWSPSTRSEDVWRNVHSHVRVGLLSPQWQHSREHTVQFSTSSSTFARAYSVCVNWTPVESWVKEMYDFKLQEQPWSAFPCRRICLHRVQTEEGGSLASLKWIFKGLATEERGDLNTSTKADANSLTSGATYALTGTWCKNMSWSIVTHPRWHADACWS